MRDSSVPPGLRAAPGRGCCAGRRGRGRGDLRKEWKWGLSRPLTQRSALSLAVGSGSGFLGRACHLLATTRNTRLRSVFSGQRVEGTGQLSRVTSNLQTLRAWVEMGAGGAPGHPSRPKKKKQELRGRGSIRAKGLLREKRYSPRNRPGKRRRCCRGSPGGSRSEAHLSLSRRALSTFGLLPEFIPTGTGLLFPVWSSFLP